MWKGKDLIDSSEISSELCLPERVYLTLGGTDRHLPAMRWGLFPNSTCHYGWNCSIPGLFPRLGHYLWSFSSKIQIPLREFTAISHKLRRDQGEKGEGLLCIWMTRGKETQWEAGCLGEALHRENPGWPGAKQKHSIFVCQKGDLAGSAKETQSKAGGHRRQIPSTF